MATTEPQKWSATLGASADVNSLPATTPAGSGRASTSGLFPQITQKPLDEGGLAPERADFNALFKYLGEYIYYVMQGGVFSYLSTYAYTAGNLATFSGAVYECIAANGPGNVHAPTDTAYWRKLATLQDIPPAATVNDGQLTINVNGSQVATFTANQAGNTTADITVPAAPTVGDGTITLHVAGSPSGSFTTNQTSNSIINVNKASDTAYGVVKVGAGITVSDGVISCTGGGGGTLSGTILGGFVGSASDSAGRYSGSVGSEYNNYELFGSGLGIDFIFNSVFSDYPAGTKFECVVASSALKRGGGNTVYTEITPGAFKLKSLGHGMIRYLLKNSAPSVGSTVTSNSDRYVTDSNIVWLEKVRILEVNPSTNKVKVSVILGYQLPSGTSYVVDSIIATYEHPAETDTQGWAGGPCYKCVVHAPS